MPGWLKVILIIFGVCFIAAAAMVFFTVRYFRMHSPELAAAARAERDAGQQFGAGKPPEDCIDAGMERARQADNLRANIKTRIFVDGCLHGANPSPTFCQNMPSGFIAMAKWEIGECGRRGLAGNQACTAVVSEWARFCGVH